MGPPLPDTGRGRGWGLSLLSLLLITACAVSPEAARARGGGPGADIGNHGAVVEIHGKVDPAHDVPGVGKSAKVRQGTESTTNAPKGTTGPSR